MSDQYNQNNLVIKKYGDVVLDGHIVPNITGKVMGDNLSITLDERFGYVVPLELAVIVVSAMANSMAIAAGYSSFGENSILLNPFKRKAGVYIPDLEK